MSDPKVSVYCENVQLNLDMAYQNTCHNTGHKRSNLVVVPERTRS